MTKRALPDEIECAACREPVRAADAWLTWYTRGDYDSRRFVGAAATHHWADCPTGKAAARQGRAWALRAVRGAQAGDMQFDHDLRVVVQRGLDGVMSDYGATAEGLAQLRAQFAPQLEAVFSQLFAEPPATARRRRQRSHLRALP